MKFNKLTVFAAYSYIFVHSNIHTHSLQMSLLPLQLQLHGLCYMVPHTSLNSYTTAKEFATAGTSYTVSGPLLHWHTYSRLPAIQSVDQFYIQHCPTLPTVHKLLLAIQRLEHFYVTYIATLNSPRELAIQRLGPKENYVHIHVLSFIHSRSTTLHSQAYIYIYTD